MPRGRKPKPQTDKLRAISWHWALKRGVTEDLRAKLTDEQLADFLGKELADERLAEVLGSMSPTSRVLADAKQLGRYRRGEKNPSGKSLECVERLYAGTKMFFDSGPWFSHLWLALDPYADPRDALKMIESTWKNSIHVENEICIGGEQGIQDVVIPRKLAARWKVKSSARLNLLEKCDPWESLNDLCGQVIPIGMHEIYSAGGVLTLEPSMTFTKDERLKKWPKIRLPFFAGLSYRIAQTRIKSENSLILDPAAEPHITEFSGGLLQQLCPKLKAATGFDIVIEQGIPLGLVPPRNDRG